jgi:hypothetical protein
VEDAESAIPLQSRPEVTDYERKKGETQLMEQLQKLSAAEALHPTDRRKFAYISKALSQISCNDCARGVMKVSAPIHAGARLERRNHTTYMHVS